MPPYITPTVGRVVWYWPSPNCCYPINAGAPLAAIIACVWTDSCVNLAVFDANGNSHSECSQLLWQEGMAKPSHCYAEWMPYQKKVASGEIAPALNIEACPG